MVSKSANYCFTNARDNTGVLLLCDVALGDHYERFDAEVRSAARGKNIYVKKRKKKKVIESFFYNIFTKKQTHGHCLIFHCWTLVDGCRVVCGAW